MPTVQPIGRADVDKALLELERAAPHLLEQVNMIRAYLNRANGVPEPEPQTLVLQWPTNKRPPEITSHFGVPRSYGPHEGTDFRTGPKGNIVAACDGVVWSADNTTYTAYGNCVVVIAAGNYRIFYGHLSSIAVKVGQTIRAGDVLGVAGDTGNAQGIHLHFGVKDQSGKWLNPEQFLVWPPTTSQPGGGQPGGGQPGGGQTLRGLHMHPTGDLPPSDYECIIKGGIKAVKLMTSNPPETVDKLVSLGIEPANIIVRLFADMADRVVMPASFCDWMMLPIRLYSAKGVRYFEIHNEPNLPNEGLEHSWMNASQFAVWYADVLRMLRGVHAGIKLGFPGLSPQPNVGEWLTDCANVIRASDWIGVHCYWTNASLIDHPEHGGYWKRFVSQFPGKQIMITEFSNPSANTSMRDKGKEYKQYWQQLPNSIEAAFCFISSADNFPHEAWVDENGNFTGILDGLG